MAKQITKAMRDALAKLLEADRPSWTFEAGTIGTLRKRGLAERRGKPGAYVDAITDAGKEALRG